MADCGLATDAHTGSPVTTAGFDREAITGMPIPIAVVTVVVVRKPIESSAARTGKAAEAALLETISMETATIRATSTKTSTAQATSVETSGVKGAAISIAVRENRRRRTERKRGRDNNTKSGVHGPSPLFGVVLRRPVDAKTYSSLSRDLGIITHL
jgi:hypothetical protein